MKISRPVLVNVSLAVVIALAIAGCIVFLVPKSSATATEATQLTTTVQQGAVSSTITASGSITARSEVTADFEVSGTVKSVDVALGETVKKGQKLGTLVKGDFNDALADAEEDLADAQANVTDAYTAISDAESDADSSDEQTASSAEQALSSAEDQLDSAQDQVETAQDAVDVAEENVDATTLHSPIAGLITAVTGTKGGTSGSSSGSSSSGASTGDTTTASGFVTIADVSKMTMTAAIAEADIADVEVGQTVDITFPALTDVTTTATVTAVAPTATSSNSVVTYATTITLDEIPDGLRLGQTAEATITTATSADDALYVPTAAITTATDGTSTVDVIGDDDAVTTTTVELGAVGDEGTEITSGLESGQTVVLGEVAATDDTDTGFTDTGGFGGAGGGTGGFTGGAGGTGGFPGGGTGGGPGQ